MLGSLPGVRMAGNATVCHALQAAVQSRAGLHRPKGSPVRGSRCSSCGGAAARTLHADTETGVGRRLGRGCSWRETENRGREWRPPECLESLPEHGVWEQGSNRAGPDTWDTLSGSPRTAACREGCRQARVLVSSIHLAAGQIKGS